METRVAGFALGGIAIAHLACAKIAGIDEYRVGADANSGAVGTPTLARAECVGCIHERCEAELTACLRDPDCAAVWECRKACRDPACHRVCFTKAPVDVQFDSGYQAILRELDDRVGCVTAQCEEPCRRGRSWECLGDYEPPQLYAVDDRIELTFDVRVWGGTVQGTTPLSDVRVRACREGSVACNPAVAEAVSTAGRVDLAEVPTTDATGFRGQVAFHDERQDAGAPDGGIDRGPLLDASYASTLPSIEGLRLLFYPATRALYDTWLPVVDSEFEPECSYLLVAVRDCDFHPAADLTVDVSTMDAETKRFYWEWGGLPALSALAATTLEGTTSFNFVPADLGAVVTAKNSTGEPVAKGSLVPIAGSYAVVALFPLTRQQARE